MAGSTMVSHQTNGLPNFDHQLYAVSQFEKILKIRDEVVAGTHPRLHISSKPDPKVAPLKSQSPPGSASTLSNGAVATSKAAHVPKSSYHSPVLSSQPSTNILSVMASYPRQNPVPTITSSGLDPIFLTKSEDLIKAEMKLQRQRIERALDEQVQQKRQGNRQRISDQEALPEFDVSEVLSQAQQLVKPIAAAESIGANGIASSSDSFDENTFYSSQINESGTDDADEHTKKRKTKPCKYFFEGSCKKGDACTFSHDAAFKQKLQVIAPLTPQVGSPDASREPYPQQGPTSYNGLMNGNGNRALDEMESGLGSNDQIFDATADQNSAHSKKRPKHHGTSSRDNYGGQSYMPGESLKPNPDPSSRRDLPNDVRMDQEYYQEDYDSPNGRLQPNSAPKRNGHFSPGVRDVRIVQSHITSPVAPQPARVSPLAVAKVPRLDQLRRSEQDVASPRNPRQPAPQSPMSGYQPASSRKRRREPDVGENTRNVAARRDLASPLPYIKDEPVSPPPFMDYPGQQSSHYDHIHRQPVVVDSTPPHLIERVVYQQRPPDPIHIESPDLRHVSTPVTRRVISRTGHHYEVQEEPDLRRIVSARQPRRIISPEQDLGHYSAPQPRMGRAASHSHIVNADTGRQQLFRPSVQPQPVAYNRAGPRPDRSLSPELRRVQYSPIEREPALMAPPPRRIVVDQYGKKYYETPMPVERVMPVERKASVAPAPRYVDEPSITFEQPAFRRASVQPQHAKPYLERSYVTTMQSPGPTSPRYVEYYPSAQPIHDHERQRVYEPREERYRDRNDLVQVVEYPPERSTRHYEDVSGSREGVVRMHSVHPSGVQYEMAREHAPSRMQTVQPEPRRMIEVGSRQNGRASVVHQVSMRGDDRYERHPAYVAMEEPRYQYISNTRHADFVDGEVQDELVAEGPRSVGRRPLQRL
ncbi:hypothetical protein MMC17_002038 [Xylographa soralifera]|nr:hypothetical protein [Xylographa soralifera]